MSDTTPANQLKNRILGAVLLVVLAVLVVPLFLGEPKDQIDLRTEAPSADIKPDTSAETSSSTDTDFQSRISRSSSVTEAADKAAAPAQSTPTSSNEVATNLSTYADKVATENSAPRQEQPKVIVPTEKKPEEISSKGAASKSTAPVATERGWGLQVGIFSKPPNAESVIDSLKVYGFAPHFNKVTASFGPATRVWLGPYATLSEAKTASQQLESKTGNKGYITKLPFKTQ